MFEYSLVGGLVASGADAYLLHVTTTPSVGYVGYLISLGVYSFKGMRVGLDWDNGSSWNIAKVVFDALGVKTYVINADPD